MRQVPKHRRWKRIQFPKPSELRPKWKTIAAMAIISIAAFSLGVYANRVVVQQVQSIGGNHVGVPAPELQILNSFWNVNLNQSLVTQVALNLTTVGASGPTPGFKTYQVFVQISCLSTSGVRFTCSTGASSIILPTSLNGASAILPVSVSPPIDPETTEIDDLSFIVTGRPITTPSLIVIPNPASPLLTPVLPGGRGMATVSFALMSINGFSGTDEIKPRKLPPGITMIPTGISAGNITITPGETVVDQWEISAIPDLPGDQLICLDVTQIDLPANSFLACIWLLRSPQIVNLCVPDFALLVNLTDTLPRPPFTINRPPATSSVLEGVFVQSLCGYTGMVTLTDVAPPDLVVSIAPPNPALVPPLVQTNQPTFTETITAFSGTALGPHSVLNIATDGKISHTVNIVINVV